MKAKKIYIIMICLLILSSCRSNKNSNPNNTSSTQNNSATISKNIKDLETKKQKKRWWFINPKH